MAARSVQISVDEELLALIDEQPEAKKHGRSALIRDALRMYLARNREAVIDEAYRRGYGGTRGATEFDDLLGGQAWPDE